MAQAVIYAPEVQASYAQSYSPTATAGTATTCTQNGSNAWIYRTFLEYDLSELPVDAVITEALLCFYCHSWNDNGGVDTYNVGRVTASWDELTLTWNNQPSISGEYMDTWEHAPTVGTWGEWDITSLVEEWFDGTYDNYGLRMISSTEGGYRKNWDLRNRRYGETEEFATYLKITYEYTSDFVSSGTYIATPVELDGHPDLRLIWEDVLDYGTSVTGYFGINESGVTPPVTWAEVENNGEIEMPDEQTGKYLWIKLLLETADVTVTPYVTALWLEEAAADPKKIQIDLSYSGRMKHPQGEVTVDFTGSMSGSLGSQVAPFEESFVPTDLVLWFKPNDPERLELQDIVVSGQITTITYPVHEQPPEDFLELSDVLAAGVLTHIDDLPE